MHPSPLTVATLDIIQSKANTPNLRTLQSLSPTPLVIFTVLYSLLQFTATFTVSALTKLDSMIPHFIWPQTSYSLLYVYCSKPVKPSIIPSLSLSCDISFFSYTKLLLCLYIYLIWQHIICSFLIAKNLDSFCYPIFHRVKGKLRLYVDIKC